jgi:hypothetical protein
MKREVNRCSRETSALGGRIRLASPAVTHGKILPRAREGEIIKKTPFAA